MDAFDEPKSCPKDSALPFSGKKLKVYFFKKSEENKSKLTSAIPKGSSTISQLASTLGHNSWRMTPSREQLAPRKDSSLKRFFSK
jgi:hypothetical protein